ncbi:hypothetical protein ABBQ32_010365 [Trebouxia sp. C0010 RCD-2024]
MKNLLWICLPLSGSPCASTQLVQQVHEMPLLSHAHYGAPAKDDVGTLFRSLAADSFTSEQDHGLYKRHTQSDRLVRREQIEEGVRERFAGEEADLQRIAEQRRWLEAKGGKKKSWQSKDQGPLQRESLLTLNPVQSDFSHSNEEGSGMLGAAEPADYAEPASADNSNMMSVTMLLRRSPELDVATLGGMNLVSSTTLQQPTTPPSRAQSHQQAVSNQTCLSGAAEHVPLRAYPRGRNTVVPHTIHLRDVHTHTVHVDLGREVEYDRPVGKSQPWHSAQHSRSMQHSMPQHAEQTKSSSSMHARSSNSHPRIHAHADSGSEGAAFDLYHHSQKLTEQLQAGLKWELSDMSGASAATSQGRRSPGSRASSISPAGADLEGGAYSLQEPALDTDASAADAAAVSAESHSSGSAQRSALDTQLSGKSTVRFMLAGSNLSNDPGAVSAAPIPTEIEDEDAGHAVAESEDAEGAEPLGAHGLWASQRTLSSTSSGLSLKGVLKKSMSRKSTVIPPYGTSPALESSGVSFALTAEEDSMDEDPPSCMPSGALLKQGSESFPAWLTAGEDIPSLPAVEDEAPGPGAEVGSSVFGESAGETVPSVTDSSIYRAHAQPGLKAQADMLQDGQRLQEKRTRMIAQPTAVQISARLLAIKQIATCC